MKEISFGKSGLRVSAVVVGCMRLSGLEGKEQEKFVGGALDLGLNFFDPCGYLRQGRVRARVRQGGPLARRRAGQAVHTVQMRHRPGSDV